MRPVFEQRLWEPRSYTRHLQCLLHLPPPSEPRSGSGFPVQTKFRLSRSWCTHIKLEAGHGARLAMFSARFQEASWKHCQPGAIHNGTSALLNGTCIPFPEMRPVFEQKSWEPRSYTRHLQCLLHLPPPSEPRSGSGFPVHTRFRLSRSWCTHIKLEAGHGARLAMFSARFKESSWKHCQPGAIHNGTLALLNRTCILFPEMRPVFEQKSWEPRSYTRHLQCLLHLPPPSEPRSGSGFPVQTKFRLSRSWCTHIKLEAGHGARLAMFSARFKESSWKHCQPGAIHNGTLALLNGTCILFPEMRPVFEQKSWEPRSYKGHIQCLLHLLAPSKPRSRSGSPWKSTFRAVHKVVHSLCQRRFLQEDSWRLKMSKVSHYDHVWSLSLRIHGAGIKFAYMNGWLFMVHVGKYASPMDPMGMSTKELGSLN